MDPRKDYKDKLDGAAHEILSAMSSLNMEPAPLDPPEGEYLSSRDKWAKHALGHIEAAFELIQEYRGFKPGSVDAGASHDAR